MNKAYTYFAALVLGVMTAFSFAPFGIFPLAVLAPAGLLALIMQATPKKGAALGFTYGLGLFGAGVYWVFISIHSYGDAPIYLAGLLTFGLAAVLALYPAAACYLTNRYFAPLNRAKLVLAFPASWVTCECLRSWLLGGFPWLLLGYSQTDSPLKGYAPFLSVYGVSLAVLISSGLIVHAVLSFKQKSYRALYFSLLAIATIWILGTLLSLIHWTRADGKPLTISLVQGNIPQSIKWDPAHIQLSFDRYAELTEPLWGKSNIIVWPEAAIPMTLQDAADFVEKMDAKARASGSALVLGIPTQNPDGEGYYNTIIGLGETKQAYQKRVLVPFGEYVPMQQVASRVFDFMHVPLPDLRAGAYHQAPFSLGGVKVATSICFEIAYPELNNPRDPSIGMLLTVTNDAWFNGSSAQAQHLQIARMRAIELARPILFASNDGITAMIGPAGNIEVAAPTHVPAVLTGTVQPMIGYTPWIYNGMDPLAFTLICLFFFARRACRQQDNTSKDTESNLIIKMRK